LSGVVLVVASSLAVLALLAFAVSVVAFLVQTSRHKPYAPVSEAFAPLRSYPRASQDKIEGRPATSDEPPLARDRRIRRQEG